MAVEQDEFRDIGDEIERAGRRFSWRSLQAVCAVGLLISLAALTYLSGFLPVVVAIALALLLGLFLLRRTTRAGVILILVATAVTAYLTWWQVFHLLMPRAFFEFAPALLWLLSTVLGVIAAICALAQGRESTPSGAARTLAVGGLVLLFAGGTISAYLRYTYTGAAKGAGDLSVVSPDFSFRPQRLQAEAGEIVVHYRNSDAATHSFSIDELGVSLFLPGGTQDRVRFRADRGTYTFYCEPHPEMTGTLRVG